MGDQMIVAPLVPEEERAFVTRMRDESCRWIAKRTVTLLIEEQPGLLTQFGTAILLAVAESVWLISAGHVLGRARRYPFWINPAAPGARPIPLQGVTIHRTEDENKADFAFVELPAETRRELAMVKAFVRLDEVDWEPQSRSGLYGAFGYPSAINVRRATSPQIPTTGMFYATRSHRWKTPPPHQVFDPMMNVAIDFDIDRSRDESGEFAEVPKPNGMSGGGMWRLFVYNGVPSRWTTEDIRLSAIQHELAAKKHGRRGVLVGIRFCHVLWTMCQARPELHAVFALYQRPDIVLTGTPLQGTLHVERERRRTFAVVSGSKRGSQ